MSSKTQGAGRLDDRSGVGSLNKENGKIFSLEIQVFENSILKLREPMNFLVSEPNPRCEADSSLKNSKRVFLESKNRWRVHSVTAKTKNAPYNWSRVKSGWKKLWQNDEAKFRITTSLKMTAIPLFSFLILGSFIWTLLSLNVIFFKANEYMKIKEFEEVFYHFISNELVELLPYGALLIVFVNMAAIYLSDILLRPFRLIGEYCEARTNGKDASYNPDFFSDLKLLSRFSEFFFSHIETAQKNRALQEVVIPKKYTKIHQPVFETTFFLHYSLYILASLLVVSIAMYSLANGLYEGIISLGSQTLPNSQAINTFLNDEKIVIHQIVNISMVTGFILYFVLASHLYYKVSAPAFAVFATMRAFLKGNHSQRVHLIGFPYLRPQMRKFNKYLDAIEKELAKKEVAES